MLVHEGPEFVHRFLIKVNLIDSNCEGKVMSTFFRPCSTQCLKMRLFSCGCYIQQLAKDWVLASPGACFAKLCCARLSTPHVAELGQVNYTYSHSLLADSTHQVKIQICYQALTQNLQAL